MNRQFLDRMTGHIVTSANRLVKLWREKQMLANGEAFDAKVDLKLAMMVSPNSSRLENLSRANGIDVLGLYRYASCFAVYPPG